MRGDVVLLSSGRVDKALTERKGKVMNDLALQENGPLTAANIRAQVQLIQEVMKAVMVRDVHYGTIPGTQKPTLYKAGSEKILSTFRISVDLEVEDLSTYDCFRYRVKARGISPSGAMVGCGIGEASTDEEKYKWRGAVCQEEADATPEDRKRTKWVKGWNGQPNKAITQIRTNPADLANTVLKMAKKRAQIDLTLTATAASDVFDQDLEDMDPGLIHEVADKKPPIQPPQKKEPEDGKISDAQKKRFYAIAKGSGKEDTEIKAYLKEQFNIESTVDIPRDKYETACEWAGAREVGAEG